MELIEVMAAVALVFWALLSLDRRRSWPSRMRLPSTDPEKAETLESLVAIVPARNEASSLPDTLPSLLVQGVRVVLVDDGSEDGTADVASRMASELGLSDQLEVVRAGPTPGGWSGKVHAQHCGYLSVLKQAAERKESAPEWLLLTDADIRHRSRSIESLLRQARQGDGDGKLDLVSIMARLRADGFWERVIIPAFVFFFQLLYPFRLVASQGSRIAAAAGGCVLVRRSKLEDAGGFAAIGGEMIDDVALGRAIKERGGRIWLGLDPGIVSVRSYDRLEELWRMVSRTAFTQLSHRWDLLAVTLIALAVLLVAPPILLAAAVGGVATAGIGGVASLGRAALWAALAWALMSWAYLPAVRHHGVPLRYTLTLPLAGLLFGLMTADSARQVLRGRGPSWRGRHYGPS